MKWKKKIKLLVYSSKHLCYIALKKKSPLSYSIHYGCFIHKNLRIVLHLPTRSVWAVQYSFCVFFLFIFFPAVNVFVYFDATHQWKKKKKERVCVYLYEVWMLNDKLVRVNVLVGTLSATTVFLSLYLSARLSGPTYQSVWAIELCRVDTNWIFISRLRNFVKDGLLKRVFSEIFFLFYYMLVFYSTK